MKTFGQRMLEAAARGAEMSGKDAGKISAFILSCQGTDGGFRGHGKESDLYYTMFALEGLSALGADFDRDAVGGYIHSKEPEDLDFIHCCCLARCISLFEIDDANLSGRIIRRINEYRGAGGGFSHTQLDRSCSGYGCFLATGAYDDLGVSLENQEAMLRCVENLLNPDGSYKNQAQDFCSTVPSTAAAVSVLSRFGRAVRRESIDRLIACKISRSGFGVSPQVPFADLLSTASALFALRLAEVESERFNEGCVEFVMSLLKDAGGGFCANEFDGRADCEYTFYGLMSLGLLTE